MIRQVLVRLSLLTTLLAFVSTLGWALPGDPARGEALYVGTVSFSAGGAPCLACHGIAGHELGLAAGANYGPDLTALFEDYGEEGILGVLEDLSFESMEAIYSSRPLTESETADLVVFFEKVSTGEAPEIGSDLALHVFIVTAIFMMLIGALGWRRLQGVRKPLVQQARNSKGEVV
jgi:mono/diheme cytochrome c family protein